MSRPVHVEGRRAVDAAANPAHEVLVHPGRVGVRGQIGVEPLDVEPELTGIGVEVGVREMRLALLEHVVHLPEPALCAGRLGGLGRLLRVGV